MRRRRHTRAPMIKLSVPPEGYQRDESIDTIENQL